MIVKKPLIQQFLVYLRKPTLGVTHKPSWQMILFNVVRLWALVFVFSIFFAMLSNLVLGRAGYSEEDFVITEIVMDFPYFLVFFLVAIWAPLSEEIAFRLGLRFSPLNWALSLSFLSLFLFSIIDLPFLPSDFLTFNSWLSTITTTMFILFTALLIFRILSYKKIATFVEKFFRRNFRYFFYTLAILFGALHIMNYDINFKDLWFFTPILIAPQLLLSFMISFVRMQYGFVWAIFTHAFNNVVAITPILFLLPALESLEGMELSEIENMEVFEIFSLSEIVLVVAVSIFLLVIFLVCFLSVFSLLFEFFKKDSN